MSIPLRTLRIGSEVDPKLIEDVRSQLLDEFNTNSDQYNNQDINRVKSDDWQIQRFLLVNKNKVDETVKAIIKTMKWRKSYGVLSLKDSDFPSEYSRASCAFVCGQDKNGANVIVFRSNIHQRIEEWDSVIKKFVVYNLEKEDKNFNGNGCVLLFDSSGMGYSNLDMDLLQFVISLVRDHYPKLVTCLLPYEMPFILQYIVKLVKSWLPEEQRRIIFLTTKKDINNYIDWDQLPPFMGGTNPKPLGIVDNNSKGAEELAERYGISKKSVDALLNVLNKYISN